MEMLASGNVVCAARAVAGLLKAHDRSDVEGSTPNHVIPYTARFRCYYFGTMSPLGSRDDGHIREAFASRHRCGARACA